MTFVVVLPTAALAVGAIVLALAFVLAAAFGVFAVFAVTLAALASVPVRSPVPPAQLDSGGVQMSVKQTGHPKAQGP